MKYKVAFAKLGKSLKFASHFSSIGGDNEPAAFLKALANNNPDIDFYIVGRSDFKKLTESERSAIFPYGNVIDCWNGVSKNRDDVPYYLLEYFKTNDIKIDFGIIMFGQVAAVTVPGTKQIKDKTLNAAVVDMTRSYTSPITIWLNESKIPYIEVINDPRYHSGQPRDLMHYPMLSLSQYDGEYIGNKIINWETQEIQDIKFPMTYNCMEVGYCYGKKLPNILKLNKDTKFTIVLNEGTPSRYKMLKEWVLDYNDNVNVYGKWEHKNTINDSRFKGSRTLDELEVILQQTKYTFIIPIAKGWVTSKYIEMIQNGVIPFFHPTYDEQLHINVPEILRVKSPKELYDNIQRLEDDPIERENVLIELNKILKPEYYDGTFLSNEILSKIIPNYELPDLSKFEKKIVEPDLDLLDFMK